MFVIGLHGPMQSGKDTGSEFVHEWAAEHGVFAVRRGFADLLKLSAARIFYPTIDMPEAIDLMNALKLDENRSITLGIPHHRWGSLFSSEEIEEKVDVRISGRELLQRYGTESHRDVFDPDFWLDQLLPRDELKRIRAVMRHDESKRYPAIVTITDTRFDNEAKRIFLCRGEVWRIVRPDQPQTDTHISEKVLHPHLVSRVLDNHKSVAEYREKIRSICDELHAAGRFDYDAGS